jgi:anti-sigma factor RsiW
MRGDVVRREARTDSADQILWRRSCMIETVEDECALFLDLAAFSEGRLDPDERERVAERLRSHPDIAGDIDAARALASAAPHEALSEAAAARACALVGTTMLSRQGIPGRLGSVVPFPMRAGRKPVLGTIAQWGSLAAALVVAGWLGFTLGMDTSGMLARSGGPAADDGVAQDLLGSPPAFFRDLTGGA